MWLAGIRSGFVVRARNSVGSDVHTAFESLMPPHVKKLCLEKVKLTFQRFYVVGGGEVCGRSVILVCCFGVLCELVLWCVVDGVFFSSVWVSLLQATLRIVFVVL